MPDQDLEIRRARDLERYHRRTAERRAQGLCPKCGKQPPAPGRSQCEPCAGKKRPADRARHYRRAAERTTQGLCPKCGKQPPALRARRFALRAGERPGRPVSGRRLPEQRSPMMPIPRFTSAGAAP